jgi:hypothetical protein
MYGLSQTPDMSALFDAVLTAPRQLQHLGKAEQVDRQQGAVQQRHHQRPAEHPVGEKPAVAADREPAQRNHRLDERAGDREACGSGCGAQRKDLGRRRQGVRQCGARHGGNLLNGLQRDFS